MPTLRASSLHAEDLTNLYQMGHNAAGLLLSTMNWRQGSSHQISTPWHMDSTFGLAPGGLRADSRLAIWLNIAI